MRTVSSGWSHFPGEKRHPAGPLTEQGQISIRDAIIGSVDKELEIGLPKGRNREFGRHGRGVGGPCRESR